LSGGGGPTVNPGILPPGTGQIFPQIDSKFPAGEGGFKPFGGSPGGGVKAMPPGGIIGRNPEGGLGQPARLGPQRVNPVGGVIGEGGPGMMGGGRGLPSGTRSGSNAAGRGGVKMTGQQPYGQTTGRHSSRRAESHDAVWDPDNPWTTDEGVDPVVLPAPEQRVDPGPAIGLG
jgi:hypothetical protein